MKPYSMTDTGASLTAELSMAFLRHITCPLNKTGMNRFGRSLHGLTHATNQDICKMRSCRP